MKNCLLIIFILASNLVYCKDKFPIEDLRIMFSKPNEMVFLNEDYSEQYKGYAIDLVDLCNYNNLELRSKIESRRFYIFSNLDNRENIIFQSIKNVDLNASFKILNEYIENKCLLIGKDNLEIISKRINKNINIGNYNSLLLKTKINNEKFFNELFIIQLKNELLLVTFNNLEIKDNSEVISTIEYLASEKYLNLIQNAFDAIKKSNVDDAFSFLNNAIDLDFDNSYGYKIRSSLFIDNKRYKEALKDIQFILMKNPFDVDMLINKAICEYNLEDYTNSIKDLETVIISNISFVSDYSNISISKYYVIYDYLSHCYNKTNNNKKAVEYALLSLSNTSDSINISYQYYNIGTVFSNKMNKPDTAIKYYTKALNFANKVDLLQKSKIYYNRGLQYRKLNNFNQAIQDYSKAITFNPNYFSAYLNRSTAYLKIDKYSNAINDCNYIINNNKVNDNSLKNAYLNRGLALILMDKDGCKDIKKAEELGLEVDANISASCK